jgi:hypothetical protein
VNFIRQRAHAALGIENARATNSTEPTTLAETPEGLESRAAFADQAGLTACKV